MVKTRAERPKGSYNKLTEIQHREIQCSPLRPAKLKDQYNVGLATIYHILNNRKTVKI